MDKCNFELMGDSMNAMNWTTICMHGNDKSYETFYYQQNDLLIRVSNRSIYRAKLLGPKQFLILRFINSSNLFTKEIHCRN